MYPDRVKENMSSTSSTGTSENPEARARYEWMRLRNPATNEIPHNIREKELKFAAQLPQRENIDGIFRKASSTDNNDILDWTSRGPYNVGGRTRALAI